MFSFLLNKSKETKLSSIMITAKAALTHTDEPIVSIIALQSLAITLLLTSKSCIKIEIIHELMLDAKNNPIFCGLIAFWEKLKLTKTNANIPNIILKKLYKIITPQLYMHLQFLHNMPYDNLYLLHEKSCPHLQDKISFYFLP